MDEQNKIDEGAQVEAQEPVAEQTAEEATVVPPELEGIDDEEIVKEVMEEAKVLPPEPVEPVQEDKAAPGPIPYARFKEKIDEGKKKDAEIEELKKQLAAMRQAPPQQYQPQYQPQQVQQPPRQQPRGLTLNDENVKLINQAIQAEAMQMSQITKEDLDSMEYMEDDDPRKVRWQYAQEMARGAVFDRIRQAQAAKATQARQFLEAHQRMTADFNAYAQKMTQEPDFEAVKNYAVNDFFKALPTEDDKAIIAAAYARVESNVASPEDIYLIKNFYSQARQAYHAQGASPAKTTNKADQAGKFPRSSQVSGSGDAGGGVTVASLEKMLNEMPFDQIDPKYQKLLLGE